MDVRAVHLIELSIPLVRPFRTSFGEERDRRAILVRVEADAADGWGECVASTAPRYSEEWVDGAWVALGQHLVPSMLDGGAIEGPEEVAGRLRWARGHRMAKASLEAAVLDAWLRLRNRGLASYLGTVHDRVECGVSVGIAPSFDELMDEVHGYLERGYRRVKLKIEPGWDVDVVSKVREAVPDTPLSVDANAAYTLDDADVFRALDGLDLLMIEQPLDHEDLVEHASLQALLRTPICLDESIRSARDALAAIELGACRIINIKPGRVGGLLEAKRTHDVALARGVPVWIGGMLETGVGRAANLALAALPGVTLPGDTSESARYFREDVTEPFILDADGTMAVPAGPGIGVVPLAERVEAFAVRRTTVSGGRR